MPMPEKGGGGKSENFSQNCGDQAKKDPAPAGSRNAIPQSR